MKEPSKIHIFRLPIELRAEPPVSAIFCLKSNSQRVYGLFVFFKMPEDRTKITIAEGVEVIPLLKPITLVTANGEITASHAILIREFTEDNNIFEVSGLVSILYCGGTITAKYLEMFDEVGSINFDELSKKSKVEVVSEIFYRFENGSPKSFVHLRWWDEELQQYENISASVEGCNTLLKEGAAMAVFQLGDVEKDNTEHGIPAQMDMMKRSINGNSLQ